MMERMREGGLDSGQAEVPMATAAGAQFAKSCLVHIDTDYYLESDGRDRVAGVGLFLDVVLARQGRIGSLGHCVGRI